MSAKVIEFPTRTCRLCQHFVAYFAEDGGPLGVAGLCLMLDKTVRDVHEVATKCPAYEEVDRWVP